MCFMFSCCCRTKHDTMSHEIKKVYCPTGLTVKFYYSYISYWHTKFLVDYSSSQTSYIHWKKSTQIDMTKAWISLSIWKLFHIQIEMCTFVISICGDFFLCTVTIFMFIYIYMQTIFTIFILLLAKHNHNRWSWYVCHVGIIFIWHL